MSTITTADIVGSVRDLPSLPVIVVELLRSFDDGDANTFALAEKVVRDQALSAKTLRLANSSFYGLSRKVTTIQQAITVLGFDTVRALITAAAVIDSFPSVRDAKFDFRMFWRHSIATAVCARLLAGSFNLNRNYAFICGLLHDVGRLVLVTRFAAQYEQAMAYRATHDCHVFEAERAVLGVDHAFVGRALAETWKFPHLMQKAIADHHAPDMSDSIDMPDVVHMADAIVHGLDLAGCDDELVPPVSERVWKSLGMSAASLHRVFQETESEFEEMCQLLAA